MKLENRVLDILLDVKKHGGRPLIVGGAVRDWLLGAEPKDIDVEVYGLNAEELTAVLSAYGRVDLVGVSFGVIKLTTPEGADFDFTLPRRENKVGRGHRGFIVEPDPTMRPREAAARRDFTWNALAWDPFANGGSGTLLDFFGGRRDLEGRIVRHTSEHFAEDPLRVLRGMQFAGRFGMTVATETARLCQSLAEEYPDLARERIWGEWLKWATKSLVPSKGLVFLAEVGWLALYPELSGLVGCPQDPGWHPEGDVWQHTLHSVDAGARIARREGLVGKEKIVSLLATLCHDMGKVRTTQRNANGRWISIGHAEAGVKLAESFLGRIGAPKDIVSLVLPLVREHMAHLSLGEGPSDRAIRRLAARLAPATMKQLSFVAEADHSGRPPLMAGNPFQEILERATALDVVSGKPAPILMGRHLIELGWSPGPHFGDVLRTAYQAQLDGVFTNLQGAQAWINGREE